MTEHIAHTTHVVTVKRVALAAGFVVVSLVSFSAGQQHSEIMETTEPVVEPTPFTETHLGRNSLTNPLIDYGSADTKDPELQALKQKLETNVAEFKSEQSVSELSLYFRNLDTGEWFGIGEDEQYNPASLMKTILMVVYYKLEELHPGLLDEEITYQGQYSNSANLPPAMLLAHGQVYTIDQLINRMIAQSDNIARSLLSDYLNARFDDATLDKLAQDSEIIIPANYEDEYQYTVTAKNFSGVFRVLYNTTYLSETMSEKALALLAESSYDSGIVNGMPEGVVVANKFGFSESENSDQLQFHDCGIVYAEKYPYILCVLTKTKNVYIAQGVISNISETVYQYLYPEHGDAE